MALASLILIALAASVLIVTCAASHTKPPRSSASHPHTPSPSKSSSSFKQKCVKVKKCPKNEEFSICTQSIGRAQYCSQKGQTLWQQKKKPTCTCTEGCVCKYKFLRNYNGTCIPENECSTDCGPDEVQDDCPVDCPSDFCPISDERSLSCPRPDCDQCPPPVCKCGFNRRRAENGTCILTRDCPPVDCSARPFEEYVACPPLCPTDDCSQASENGQCPIQFGNILIILPCNPTCRCIKGYWRKNGICVPYDECKIPSSCPANEEVRCVDECPPETTCNTRGIAYRCMAPVRPCQHKCVCKEGYYRNYLGTCISNDECDKCTGDNEFFACDSACDNECSNINKQNRTNCPIRNIDCNRKCYCEDGFARDKDGNCVPVEECPPLTSCPANEEVRCVNKCPPELTCKTRGRKYKCAAPVDPCENKCVCKKGYYRNSQGTCIPEDECDIPTSCPANEEVRCVNKCPPELTCETRGRQYKCPAPVDPCENKCVCKKGYYRNSQGTCICEDQCDIPTSCPANEEVRCVNKCPPERTCENRGIQFNCITPIDPCENKCVCKKGYVRNSQSTCITEDQCETPTSCPANEEVRCVDECPPERTCRTRKLQYRCMAPVDPCQNKCVCKEGYYRNFLGTCITDKECDQCSGDNEFFACDSACDNECSKLYKQNRTNCPIQTFVCNRKCYCEDGFARDKDGNCISVEECPPLTSCPANEEVRCVNKCPPELTCKTRGRKYKCAAPVDPCENKCVCKKGYYRNSQGTCIPENQCDIPTSCPANEEVRCVNKCPPERTCKNRGIQFNCITPIDTCENKCVCKKGYVRNSQGTCITEEQCDIPTSCPENEEVRCVNKCPPQLSCDTRGAVFKCPAQVDPCQHKCVCKKGYYRNYWHIPTSCPENEEVRCVNKCPPQLSCDTRGAVFKCPAQVDPCQHKCVCKKGYYRNYLGTCISNDKCDRCTGKNQFFACDSSCDNECSKIHEQNRTNCPIQNVVCNSQCFCKDGFARDKDENCVPIEECPPPNSCPANEEVRCVNKCPPELTCKTRGRQYKCAAPVDPCENKCVCKKGYYRNSQGTCIPEDECDIPTSCPANEEVRCVNKCPPERTCNNRRFTFKCAAPVDPCQYKCVCKKGYYRNSQGACITEDQCDIPTSCPENEEVRCVKNCPPQLSCDTRGALFKCPAQVDPCQHKCVCKKGYYRNYLGTCISDDECDQCTGDNQFFACDSSCDNECSKIHEQNRTNCPIQNIVCNSQCFCKDGFARDKDENCVPIEECPPPNLCPANEEVRCVNKCPPEATCKTRGRQYRCPAPVDPCENKCVCKKGYYRNSQGTCIPEDECDIPTSCPANEEVRCVNKCPPQRNCKNRRAQFKCAAPVDPCQHKCVCKKGYYRNYLGTCISNDECDQCTGDNEFFACDSACDNECSKIHEQNRTNCPIQTFVCNRQCYCEDGFARDKDKNCVPLEECPNISCPVNEEYVPCMQGVCRAMYCDQKGEPVPCPDRKWPEEECDAGCICKESYLRNKDGDCVPEDQCETNTSCPVNEEYVPCIQGVCRAMDCSQKGEPVPCPDRKWPEEECDAGCICKENYLRNEDGDCVPEDQCETEPEPTCGDNEVLDECPSDCPSDYCPKSKEDNRKCTKPKHCPPPKCKCGFNYRRSDNGTCIPTEDCPPFDCSAYPNEKWTPCPPLCPSDGCSLARVKGVCPFKIGIRLECNPKCQCKEGYGRVDGKCIPYEKCPDLCPVNEEYNSCTQGICRPQNCTNRYKPQACPKVKSSSCQKGCVCKQDYFRNDNGTCVTEDECVAEPEPTCGDNEVLDECPSDCPSDYCPKSKEDNRKCPKPKHCPPPKCKCGFNYRRSDNGTCIPTEDCPPFDCSAYPNEKWTPCPPLCPSDGCSLARVKGVCPFKIGIRLECNPKCQCKEGYGRVDGKCIPYEECPDLCPVNEEYNSCTQAICRPQKCTNRYKPQACPSVESSSCHKGCVCKQDYFRNDNGTCVTDDECVDKQCPKPNEKYALSQQPSCPALGKCLSITARIACDKPESLGCICRGGFFRDDKTSVCIPFCKCPQVASTQECQKNNSSTIN